MGEAPQRPDGTLTPGPPLHITRRQSPVSEPSTTCPVAGPRRPRHVDRIVLTQPNAVFFAAADFGFGEDRRVFPHHQTGRAAGICAKRTAGAFRSVHDRKPFVPRLLARQHGSSASIAMARGNKMLFSR